MRFSKSHCNVATCALRPGYHLMSPSSVKYSRRASHFSHHSSGSLPRASTWRRSDASSSQKMAGSNGEYDESVFHTVHARVHMSLGNDLGSVGSNLLSGGRQGTGAKHSSRVSFAGRYASPKSQSKTRASSTPRSDRLSVFKGSATGSVAWWGTFGGIGLSSKVWTASSLTSPHSAESFSSLQRQYSSGNLNKTFPR